MNEMPTHSEPTPTPGSAVLTTPPAADQPGGAPYGRAPTLLEQLQKPMSIAVIVLAVLLAAQSWSSSKQIRSLREEVAKRLQKGDISNAETGVIARNVQESNKELEIKVGALENRQSETQSQQLALEQLYNDLSKNRDEWALTEIEQVLSTASQQLQLAGNVPGALIALQNADRSLSRSDKPQFITIRRAIGRDMEKLKALPSVDSTGVALRLDTVIAQIDALPMLSDEKPALPAAPERTRKPVRDAAGKLVGPPAPEPLLQQVRNGWDTWSGDMWNDVRQLIRIRRVDTPEALMLSPTQSYFLRENIKLRLLNARMALLSRNETAFRNDLIAAQDGLAKYFDTRARATQTAQSLLRQVQASNLTIELPTLSDSLTAVRNYKAKS
ncbi:uroporphyrinogen-III C-methyltransferase [Janthinobacterium psychrotolerans]|uniref:Uroporphyrin-3 C-methyltransferase/uroporphyrinogen III methyltransferase / synthase n=1 Tax=Janthinobacterium psychrotolerans TaxID=1747903 RepID=A0A1A7C720_9BURK|nr:uroporphyrinogen-III C-methyltransferase [Janthinobacterium psychrotolerans]OBV40113.1 uroporphyrin-3 C-methyltransferase/uroporphyrinogen III methyltransferase / synthase [Janthinobacterium psychrotolerans]